MNARVVLCWLLIHWWDPRAVYFGNLREAEGVGMGVSRPTSLWSHEGAVRWMSPRNSHRGPLPPQVTELRSWTTKRKGAVAFLKSQVPGTVCAPRLTLQKGLFIQMVKEDAVLAGAPHQACL